MKRNYQIVLLALMMTGVFSACTKKIEEAYLNPNAPIRVPVEELLPQITSTMTANYAGHGPLHDARVISLYTQYFATHTLSAATNTSTHYERMGGVSGGSDNAGSIWRTHYFDVGQNNIKMIEWATEEKKWDYVGVGQAIFAWSWLQLTDYHGEVILKEAFNTNLLTFKFDKEEDVYTYVRQLCFEALANLNKTGDNVSQANLAKGDAFLYKGDVNKWKKFVYAVLARSYHHLSNKSIYKPDSVIYYCDRSLSSNDDNAYVTVVGTPGVTAANNYFGPLRNTAIGGPAMATLRQGKYITDLMKGANAQFPGVLDPRIWYMLRPSINESFNGIPVNRGAGFYTATADRPEGFWGQRHDSLVAPLSDVRARYIFRNASPVPVITASEIFFMKAEAAYRKGDKGTALTAYRRAIELHFDMLQNAYSTNVPDSKLITASIRDTYLSNPLVVPTAANLTLSHIMLQKYIALFGYGAQETWVDMRRYHYTDQENGLQVYRDFVPPTGADLWPENNSKLVYRVRYRFNSEYVWNIVELQKLGADAVDWHTKETWFSKP
ncbi:SusD/RagB family nutrient-binding outer membrane lipoprotein [Lacibacter sp. MH-610]|uniref:SusD/RagB family nutrient-binding outer membrane lipoprotein n=1 Tax=Lacibacter sp. MH-610 TaxID=3020883 RepID=UPI00389125BD